MTKEAVKEMCKEFGIFFDEKHPDHITIDKLKKLTPPFMEYVLVDDPIMADGKRYIDRYQLTIRIYSEQETTEKETTVQQVLEDHDIRWKRSVGYDENLSLFDIRYSMEV